MNEASRRGRGNDEQRHHRGPHHRQGDRGSRGRRWRGRAWGPEDERHVGSGGNDRHGERGGRALCRSGPLGEARIAGGRVRWGGPDPLWALLLILLAFTIPLLGVTRAISLSPFDEASHI